MTRKMPAMITRIVLPMLSMVYAMTSFVYFYEQRNECGRTQEMYTMQDAP